MLTHKQIIDRCRKLRKNQTPEEELLWKSLRNRNFYGLKFLRQHPIIYEGLNNRFSFFIADFYCNEKKLVIELDGKIHDEQKEYDRDRNFIVKSLGLKTVRIKNEEINMWKEIVLKALSS